MAMCAREGGCVGYIKRLSFELKQKGVATAVGGVRRCEEFSSDVGGKASAVFTG
jgi:hypothetical protein